MSPRTLRFLLLLGSVLVTLAAVELGLRAFYAKGKFHVSGWKTKSRYRNQIGFRGQPIRYAPDDFVVVLLGDSQVEAANCRPAHMPEQALQRALNALGVKAKVFSVGGSGYGQDQEYLALQQYFQSYRADRVVLWQTRTNDLWNNVFPTHWPAKNGAPKPTFWLEDGRLRGPTEQLRERVHDAPLVLMTLIGEFLWPTTERDLRWEERLPDAYRPLVNYTGTVSQSWQTLLQNKKNYLHGDNIDTEKTHLSLWFTPPSERLTYGLNLTRKLIAAISRLAERNDAPLVLFEALRPTSFASHKSEVFALDGKYYRGSAAQADETMAKIREGFRSFSVPIRLKRWESRPGGDHLSEAGVRQVMNDLAMKLIDHVAEGAR